jgi:hypothetical protein
MSHAVYRTSPMGTKFLGRCIKCGQENLGLSAPLEDCPADNLISDEAALLALIEKPTGAS